MLACEKVSDPYLLDWWARDFGGWRREYRAEALAPVQTRLSYYASSKRARAILGQSRSTIDLRRVILDGGVLLVSTAQGTAGRDVAALVGASLLNLVDSVIREQERLPLEQRRGALVVVDEMQSMPGVDYESMLSELGKYGASFVLATQSLAKLADLSPTMQDTVLANTGCLAVFQVAGERRPQARLGVGARARDGGGHHLPARPPLLCARDGRHGTPPSLLDARGEAGGGRSPGVAASIRAAAAAYTTSATETRGKGGAGAGTHQGLPRRAAGAGRGGCRLTRRRVRPSGLRRRESAVVAEQQPERHHGGGGGVSK